MEFKAKDLLITVLPQAEANPLFCLFHTRICRFPTYCRWSTCFGLTLDCDQCSVLRTLECGAGCSFLPSHGCGFQNSCYIGRSACDPTVFCPGGSRDPWTIKTRDDLVTLRAELQDTLKKLDELEKTGLPGQVSTRAEAETLERGLTEALDQVRKMKDTLK